MANIEKPMNPWATEDFKKAIEEAKENVKSAFDGVGETIAINIPAESYAEEYGGKMRLEKSTLWESLVDTLICNGYEVTVRLEEATETEREMDGASTFVVIEFREV